ncbi:MAG: secretin N-terminal domain-containing protein [Phycisphaerales bacterium JB054]
MRSITAALVATLLGLNPCRGQVDGSQVELAETVELARLVDLAAQRADVNIEYDTKLIGSVTLRLNDEVSDTELWDLANRLLAARGFTTVRMGDGDTLSVVPLSAAAGLARLEAPAEQAVVPAGFRAVLVPVRARRPEDAVAALKPILSSSGTVIAIAESRSVIVADLAPRVEAALRAVDALEAGAAALAPAEIPLENLPASRMVTLLSQIAAKRAAAGAAPLRGEVLAGTDDRSLLVVAPADEVGRWRDLVGQLDKREAVETVTYTPHAFALKEVAASVERLVGGDERFRVVADDLTGTLLVTASTAQHERVRALLDRLAEAPEAARRPTRTFKLKNRDAEEVLGVVQSLIASGVLGLAQASGGIAPSDALADTSPAAAPDSMQLTSDPATNSIIAIGEVQELQRLEQLLRDLDVRRPQVLLEVLIISLSESDALDLGVEIEAAINGPNDTVAKLASLFGLSSTGAGSAGIEGNRGAGFTGIVLNPGDFSVVLRALKSLNEGRSLSMPKVLVASNEQASINSVLEQPYTTLNASDTVATTSFGGSSNAGTEVSVTPQIAEGDHLRLEYQVSLSAFVGEAADPSVPPPRQQNSIDSVATIPDGYTIAVGGIELTTEGYSETGIPLLSDVPILGEAFKNRSKSSSRMRFYVFIRPTILRDRDFEDLKYLSDRDVADTGIDDGWPVPEPRLIR